MGGGAGGWADMFLLDADVAHTFCRFPATKKLDDGVMYKCNDKAYLTKDSVKLCDLDQGAPCDMQPCGMVATTCKTHRPHEEASQACNLDATKTYASRNDFASGNGLLAGGLPPDWQREWECTQVAHQVGLGWQPEWVSGNGLFAAGTPSDWADLTALVGTLTNTSDAAFPAALDAVMDVPDLIR